MQAASNSDVDRMMSDWQTFHADNHTFLREHNPDISDERLREFYDRMMSMQFYGQHPDKLPEYLDEYGFSLMGDDDPRNKPYSQYHDNGDGTWSVSGWWERSATGQWKLKKHQYSRNRPFGTWFQIVRADDVAGRQDGQSVEIRLYQGEQPYEGMVFKG